MKKTVQELFDAFVVEHGAVSVGQAVYNHKMPGVHPDSGGSCKVDSDCPTGYYCNGGSCTLKVGP